MFWTNEINIKFNDETIAIKALDILRRRLALGFGCDHTYKRNPSMLMSENLAVSENEIFLLNNIGCYTPEDAESVMCELIQYLAENLSEHEFSCKIWNNSDYSDSSINAKYKKGQLKLKVAYYPSGYIELICPECDCLIAEMEDYKEGKMDLGESYCICPECGEKVELDEWLPCIYKKNIKINTKN
jgi:hypothetical protein